MTGVLERRDEVLTRIADACARAGRDPASVLLVAVSKTVPAELIPREVAWDLGENRVEELLDKQRDMAGAAVTWHFVGTLQRNKAKRVVGRVALIHSLESERLADAIGRHARAAGVTQDVLVQVDTSSEPTKHGVDPGSALELAARADAIEGVRVRGFMTIPAPGDDARTRDAFARLRAIRDACDLADARELSMGMSADFGAAIEEGATIVRVGTALFGPRPP